MQLEWSEWECGRCVLCAVYCVLCAVCCVLCAVCCVLCCVCGSGAARCSASVPHAPRGAGPAASSVSSHHVAACPSQDHAPSSCPHTSTTPSRCLHSPDALIEPARTGTAQLSRAEAVERAVSYRPSHAQHAPTRASPCGATCAASQDTAAVEGDKWKEWSVGWRKWRSCRSYERHALSVPATATAEAAALVAIGGLLFHSGSLLRLTSCRKHSAQASTSSHPGRFEWPSCSPCRGLAAASAEKWSTTQPCGRNSAQRRQPVKRRSERTAALAVSNFGSAVFSPKLHVGIDCCSIIHTEQLYFVHDTAPFASYPVRC